jgi:hypothetical protein
MLRMLTGVLLFVTISSAAQTYIGHATLPYHGPVAYADKKLKIVFYAESDGRHLSAIDFDGRVLWTRIPFVDAHLKPYRVAAPRIIDIYPPLPWMVAGQKRSFIAIQFESTQAGIVDVKSGDFVPMGQD